VLERPTLAPTDAQIAKLLAPQRGTYRLDQDSRTNMANRPGWLVELEGSVDAAALERALVALRDRHTILRTRFFEADGELWQEVLDAVPHAPLERVDLSSCPPSEQERVFAELHERFVLRPFDLAGGEVIRALLIAMSPTRHRLGVVVHRIACDDVSQRLLIAELAQLWRAFSEDAGCTTAGVLPPVALQYIDLADYLARLEETAIGRSQRAYWTRQLAGAPALELPVDRPREPVDGARDRKAGFVTFPAAFTAAELSPEATRVVQHLARDLRCSVNSTLLAAMAAYLSRTTGQTDLAILNHLVYRHHPGLDTAVGLFGNPLVMRISVAGQPTYRELISRTHDVVTSAYENGECNVLDLAPSRMFRLWFNHTHVSGTGLELPAMPRGVTATDIPTQFRPRIAYDLILFVYGADEQTHLKLAYTSICSESAAPRRSCAASPTRSTGCALASRIWSRSARCGIGPRRAGDHSAQRANSASRASARSSGGAGIASVATDDASRIARSMKNMLSSIKNQSTSVRSRMFVIEARSASRSKICLACGESSSAASMIAWSFACRRSQTGWIARTDFAIKTNGTLGRLMKRSGSSAAKPRRRIALSHSSAGRIASGMRAVYSQSR
jgi:hypothetical protein